MEKIEIINEPILYQSENIDHEIVFKSEGDWIKVRKENGYYYCERKGIDSVAFVLFDKNLNDPKRIGLIKEYKNPFGKSIVTAFGGSIDEDRFKTDLRVLVQEEVQEESGFKVTLNDIAYYGKVLVSSQMNQYCYLFGVAVDKRFQGEKTTTNFREMQDTLVWLQLPEVLHINDWKAITIITKRRAAHSAELIARPIETPHSASETL